MKRVRSGITRGCVSAPEDGYKSQGQGITFFETSPVELIGDVSAMFGATGHGLELVDPIRMFDSRSVGIELAADSITAVDVGAPLGSTGVLGSVAAILPGANGFLSVFPCGTDPITSTINVQAAEVASNAIVVALGTEGAVCLRPSVDMHAVLDVRGYFSPDGMLEYQPLTPTRLVDTRVDRYYTNRLGAYQTIELPLAEAPAFPVHLFAAIFHLTSLEPY